MSGETPADFKMHSLNATGDSITEKLFSKQVSNWFGPRGFRDMRSYFRYRVLDYFNTEIIEKTGGDNCYKEYKVSNEEMAINVMFLDYILKRKYYFTANLFVSEIQRDVNLESSLISSVNLLSGMTINESENQIPLFTKDQVDEILRTFCIDPYSRVGQTIRDSYYDRDGSCCLIQLVLESLKTYSYEKRISQNVKQPESSLDVPLSKSQVCVRKTRKAFVKIKSTKRTGRRRIDRDGLVNLKERAWFRAMKTTLQILTQRIKNLHKIVVQQADVVHQVIRMMRLLHELSSGVIQRLPSYFQKKSILMKNIDLIKKWVNIIKRKQSIEQRNRRSSKPTRNKTILSKRGFTRVKSIKPQKDCVCDGKIRVELQSADAWTQTSDENKSKLDEMSSVIQLERFVEKSSRCVEENDNWVKGKSPNNERDVDEKAEQTRCTEEKLYVDQSLQGKATPSPSLLSTQVIDTIAERNLDLQKEILEQNGRIQFYTLKVMELESAVKAIKRAPMEMGQITCRDVSTNTCEIQDATIGISNSTNETSGEMNLFLPMKCNSMITALELCKREMNLLKLERRHLDEDRVLTFSLLDDHKSRNAFSRGRVSSVTEKPS